MKFMKPTMLKTAFTVVLAGLSSYFGMLTQPLLVLFFAMVLDYLTGMTKAYIFSQLSSRIGVKGILKKLCYMAMVAVGAAVDYLLHGALKQAGHRPAHRAFLRPARHRLAHHQRAHLGAGKLSRHRCAGLSSPQSITFSPEKHRERKGRRT